MAMAAIANLRRAYFRVLQLGQGLAEYALMLVLVAVAVIASLTMLGSSGVGGLWSSITNELMAALGGS